MNRFFYRLSNLSSLISLENLIKITRQRVALPLYHTVSDEQLIHIKNLYRARNSAEFERDLDFFLKYYKPVSPADFVDSIIKDTPLTENSFMLSFDDGLREFHDVIAPILLRKGIPAVCFLNSNFIDNKDLFFRYKTSILIEKLRNPEIHTKEVKHWFATQHLASLNFRHQLHSVTDLNKHLLDELAQLIGFDFNDFLKTQKPYLETAQIKSLMDKGFSFGAHSIDHPRYMHIPFDEQIRQTKESLDDLVARFNLPNRLFAFPFSDWDVKHEFFDTILDSEPPIADLSFATAGLKHDEVRKNIHRIPIEIDNYTAQEVVYGEYLYYLAKRIIHKNQVVHKRFRKKGRGNN